MTDPRIALASASPRRAELLERIGIPFRRVAVQVDETACHGESPVALARRLAAAKSAAGAAHADARGLPALGADTVVIVDGEALGKPVDRTHGLAMLERLAGRSHRVVTAIAVTVAGAAPSTRVSESAVTLRRITADERVAYWETGEPADKAGAYAIQGLGGVFVTHLAGSCSGVIGLPLHETTELLAEVGVAVFP